MTDVTLREFTDPFSHASYAGKRTPYAPDFDASLSATYRNAAGWFAAAEASWAGRTFYDESEDPAFAQSARAVVAAASATRPAAGARRSSPKTSAIGTTTR